ncbi:aspartate transaminase [Penicillium cataractarum]|uniref:Aspartate aminotransferase n=1 Tax=Penicillium cataractarum TaxID=2100454 RepID=A0A9W9V4I0_9EURO|nr:aspartate transaminase [Penicillium cataractarum]KAJ5368412.1 aspartate transaminase [Penicillium cataractarum]
MTGVSKLTTPCFDPGKIPAAPNDPLYSLVSAYEADTSADTVDLGVGAYRDENAKPWILPTVRKAKAILEKDPRHDHEYLPIAGLPTFNSAAQSLILGADSVAIKENRVCSFQTISGTGAVHLGALLISKFAPRPSPDVYISSPSWPIHDQVFTNVGLPVKHYPYFRKDTKTFDVSGMTQTLNSAPKGSIVVLHACAHNPTGVDPTSDEWIEIAKIMKANELFPFFDCAYQGFATGYLSQDNFAVRYFVEQGFQIAIAQSFAKNLGLYGERAGAFHFVASPSSNASSTTNRVASQLSILQRSEISSPPIYGAQIASIILNDPQLLSEWETDLLTMSGRIKKMRKCLKEELDRLQTPGTWDHIVNQIGMFSFTGLSPAHVHELREKWHVYMAETGRISVAGLNDHNVAYFARAVDNVVRRVL